MRIGIVGHRYIKDAQTSVFIYDQCSQLIHDAKTKYSNIVALSAIAEGADSLFAEVALRFSVPLVIVRPFMNYAADFPDPNSFSIYEKLRVAAQEEIILIHQSRSEAAYEDAMQWIVKNSDLLIAVWDGAPSRGPGGTAQAVDLAIESKLPWIHIDVIKLEVFYHCFD